MLRTGTQIVPKSIDFTTFLFFQRTIEGQKFKINAFMNAIVIVFILN